MKPTVSILSICAALIVIVGAIYLTADAAPRSPHAPRYRVVSGPVEFLGFRSLKSTDDCVTVRPLKTPLSAGEKLRMGDRVDTGIVRSAGGTFALKDAEGAIVQLEHGEAAVVLVTDAEAVLEGIPCEQCAGLAKRTCSDRCVAGVACRPDGACSFTCKDKCGPEEE